MKFVCAMVAVVALALVVASAQAVQVNVNVNNSLVPLSVERGQSFIDAARSFCSTYGVDPNLNVARLVSALERESARQNLENAGAEEPKPLVSLPLEVRGELRTLNFYEGQDAFQVVKHFASQHNLGVADQQLINQALDRELRSQPPARIIAQVPVDVDLGNGETRRVPLTVTDSQTALSAATAFAKAYNVAANAIPELVAAINRHLQPQPLFTLPLLVDGSQTSLDVFEGDRVDAVAADFCKGFGIESNECLKVRAAILARLRQLQAAAQPTQQQQAAAPAAAPAAATPAAQRSSIRVTVGSQLFNMDFDASTTAGQLATIFCQEQLNAVAAVIGDVSLDMCVSVLTREIARTARA